MKTTAEREKTGTLNIWKTFSCTPSTKQEIPTAAKEDGELINDSIKKNAVTEAVGIRTNFECYLQPWFRICYYFFLIPFKIEKSGSGGSSHFVTTNLAQKSLCALIHLGLWFAGAFEIHITLRDGNAQGNPALFIKLLDTINSGLYSICFTYTVWCKRAAVLGIFGDPRELATTQNFKRIKTWSMIVTAGSVALSMFGFTCWLLSFDLANILKESIVESLIEKSLYDDVGSASAGGGGRPTRNAEIPETTSGISVQVAAGVVLVFRFYKWLVVDLLIFLPFFTSFITYTMTKQFRQILIDSANLPADADASNVFESYRRVKENLLAFNEFMGTFYVLVFVSVITFCAGNAADILNSKGWTFPFIMFFYFVQVGGMLVLSAETHHQASYFKTWLLVPWKRSPSTLAICAEVEDSNLANKGGRLFTITYSFLGTACGVALTYAMIVIQFKGTNPTG